MELPDSIEDRILSALAAEPEDRAGRIRSLIAEVPEHELGILQWIANTPYLATLTEELDCDAKIAELAPTRSGAASDGPVEFIGPYRILRRLPSGGMGTVYVAQQSEGIVRRVAIKVINSNLESEEILSRFRLEQQTLAVLNSEFIAQIFDAGTNPRDGRPYFVMEFVPGEPITDYCDNHRLDIEARLRLFLDVCRGVQHAHKRGIFHRDLKPGNILVAQVDQKPRVKIIDFGLAKTTAPLAGHKPLTDLGQGMGTPEYMSPEQAEGLEVSAATDVYALGVILYELLVGALPIDIQGDQLRQIGMVGVARLLKTSNPPKPSTRLADPDLAEAAAKKRNTRARNLLRHLRGDLDRIVMKALASDPAHRYETSDALAMDVERHFKDEVVSAGTTPLLERVRKLSRQHRTASLLAVGLFAALVGVSVVLYGVQRDLKFWRGQIRSATEMQQTARRTEAQAAKDILAATEAERQAKAALTEAQALEEEARKAQERAENTALAAETKAKEADRRAQAAQEREKAARRAQEAASANARLQATAREQAEQRVAALTTQRAQLDATARELASRNRELEATRDRTAAANATLRRRLEDLQDIGDLVGLQAWLGSRIDGLLAAEAAAWPAADPSAPARAAAWIGQAEWLLRRDGDRFLVLGSAAANAAGNAEARALVAGLGAKLARLDDRLPKMRRRHQSLERTRKAAATHGRRWREVVTDLGAGNSPYPPVRWQPLPALAPLGKDQKTGLWHFWLLPSGARPPFPRPVDEQPAAEDGATLVLLPGAKEFRMGAQRPGKGRDFNLDPAATDQERPVHALSLAPFLIATHELSRAQWKRLTYQAADEPASRGRLPMTSISYEECLAALRDVGLTLPTEAQWEYACRAGTDTPYCSGPAPEGLSGIAHLRGVALPRGLAPTPGQPLPIGSLAANPFGLYDTHGNVREWCLDWYGMYTERVDPDTGARFAKRETGRVVRGGCFTDIPQRARSSFRFRYRPDLRRPDLGVRPAWSPER